MQEDHEFESSLGNLARFCIKKESLFHTQMWAPLVKNPKGVIESATQGLVCSKLWR